jgi:phosphatidylinositol glycan class Q protein
MYNNVQNVLHFVHKYGETIHLNFLEQEIEWLMGFPLGLKTNKNLSKLLGKVLYFIIYLWNYYTSIATPFEHILVIILCLFGFSGFSLVVAFTIDLIGILTFHVYFIYQILSFLYKLTVDILFSLNNVFNNTIHNLNTKKIQPFYFEWD